MMDELTRARLRHALLELEAVAPEMADAFLADATHGPLLREALGSRRRWVCPLCAVVVYAVDAPDGWRIVEPFARVVACSTCLPLFSHRAVCLCGHGRGAHRVLGAPVPACLQSGCGCRSFRAHR